MIAVSQVLLDFIQPLLKNEDNSQAILSKAKLGQIVWNFCVSDANNLPLDDQMKSILKNQLADSPEINEVVNKLTIRKQTLFDRYNDFIISVDLNKKNDGSIALKVISIPADKIDKTGN